MAGEDLLRNLYPDLLDLTPDGVAALAGRHPATRAFLSDLCADLAWARSRLPAPAHGLDASLGSGRSLTGWILRSNPFLRLDLARAGRLALRAGAVRPGEAALRGAAWAGIGVWVLAERYYKHAVRQAIVAGEVAGALHAGAQLSLVYLAGGRPAAGLRLAQHLAEAASRVREPARGRLARPAHTLLCLALLALRRYGEAETAGAALWQTGADESLYRLVADTLRVTGQDAGLERWQDVWWDLRTIVERKGIT